MEFLKKRGIVLYLLILFTHCAFIYFELNEWRFYSKLLLVPFLLLLFLIQFSGNRSSKNFLLPIIALSGSFLGDLLLAIDGAQFFLYGMLGFMVTHISNSLYFYSLKSITITKANYAKFALLCLSFACSFVVFTIKENAGAFFVPIIVYMFLIVIMAILSANLAESSSYNHSAIHYFIPGAVLFVLSDGLLAINKFNLQDASLDVFVMLTYGLAQLYLVMGYYKTNT
jgi:uncharacterized membrane protein YhhN